MKFIKPRLLNNNESKKQGNALTRIASKAPFFLKFMNSIKNTASKSNTINIPPELSLTKPTKLSIELLSSNKVMFTVILAVHLEYKSVNTKRN